MLVAVKNAEVEDSVHGMIKLRAGVSFVDESHEIVKRHPGLFRKAPGRDGQREGGREGTMATVGLEARVSDPADARRVTPTPTPPPNPAAPSYLELQRRRAAWRL